MQGERGRRTWEAPEVPARARYRRWARKEDNPPDAPGVSYHAEYAAVGQAHYTGKDVTEVRRPHRKLMPDTVGPDLHEPTSLRGIANTARADKRHRFRELYRCLDAHLLRAFWDDLNKAAASGVDHVTAEEYAANLQANIEA